MDEEDIIKKIKEYKNNGNIKYQNKEYLGCKEDYQQALYLLLQLKKESIKQINDVLNNNNNLKELEIVLYSNFAAVHLKLFEYHAVVEYCTKVLEEIEDPNHMKCLYRRAIAYKELGQIDKARKDINRGLDIDQNEKEFNKLKDEIVIQFKLKKDEYFTSTFSSLCTLYDDSDIDDDNEITK